MGDLRFTTAGESHGPGLVAIVEGLPAGLELDRERLDADMARRQLGHGRGGRMKIERDAVEIRSGVRHGRTVAANVVGRPRLILLEDLVRSFGVRCPRHRPAASGAHGHEPS